MSQFAVVLAAAGRSTRFGDPHTKKVFTTVAGKPLWMYAAEAFSKRSDVAQVVIVISPEDKDMFREKFAGNAMILGVETVLGGAQRADSVDRCGVRTSQRIWGGIAGYPLLFNSQTRRSGLQCSEDRVTRAAVVSPDATGVSY